jgi:hypothetical protein
MLMAAVIFFSLRSLISLSVRQWCFAGFAVWRSQALAATYMGVSCGVPSRIVCTTSVESAKLPGGGAANLLKSDAKDGGKSDTWVP